MPVGNMIVALEGTPASDTALAASIALQKAHGAHLTGYIALAERAVLEDGGQNWVPAAIRKSLRGAAEEAVARIEAQFRAATADLPEGKLHLIRGQRASDSGMAEASRFFDVTLVGLMGEGSPSTGLHPDRIALMSGRPVLAFPKGADTTRLADHAMLAWDGSRAAARALHASLRLLETGTRVTVVTVGEPKKTEVEADGLDPKTTLERQGRDRADTVAPCLGARGGPAGDGGVRAFQVPRRHLWRGHARCDGADTGSGVPGTLTGACVATPTASSSARKARSSTSRSSGPSRLRSCASRSRSGLTSSQ